MRFVPQSVWWGSANWTEGSRSHLEVGLRSTRRSLARPRGYGLRCNADPIRGASGHDMRLARVCRAAPPVDQRPRMSRRGAGSRGGVGELPHGSTRRGLWMPRLQMLRSAGAPVSWMTLPRRSSPPCGVSDVPDVVVAHFGKGLSRHVVVDHAGNPARSPCTWCTRHPRRGCRVISTFSLGLFAFTLDLDGPGLLGTGQDDGVVPDGDVVGSEPGTCTPSACQSVPAAVRIS